MLAFAEKIAKENEVEPYKRFSVTETSDAFAPGEDFAVWDDIRDEYYHDSDGTVHTFATREEAGEYLNQVEKETDRQEAAEWAYAERVKAEAGMDTSGHDVQKSGTEPEYLYKMEANPRSESINDRFFLQAYEKEGNGKAIPRDILFVGTPEQCQELLGKLENGELTQEQVKEIFTQGQEPEKTEAEKPYYKVGDTVTIEGTEFIIEDISDMEVQLRDPKLLYPVFRAESRENFERLLAEKTENAMPEPPVTTEQTIYPGDKNGLPYDIVIEKMHFGEPEHAEPEKEPEIDKSGAVNFHITDDALGIGGAKEKFRRNIEAIRTLEKIEGENRTATPEEQKILSQYVGWGGLADAFDGSRSAWAGEYQELKSLLSDAEYASARESTLNAHYTSPVIIRSIYEALDKMGFEKGNVRACGR